MKYKLIMCDYDGTLALSNSRLSEFTKQTVREYVKRGGIFVINTGRLYCSAEPYVYELGADKQKISVCAMNGSYVQDNDGNVLYSNTISYETTLKIAKAIEEYGVYLHVYKPNTVLIKEENEINRMYKKLCGVPLEKVGKISEYVEKNRFCAMKALAFIQPEQREDIFAYLDSLKLEGVKYFMTNKNFLEFVPFDSGKELSSKMVADHLGIDMKDVMAFGDNENDALMIKEAGFGVAVSNALDSVKAVADYVCESNDEDGVAKTIIKYCLED